MSYPLTDEMIARAYLDACRLDVAALKPGNVHRYAGGHGMDVADFEKSAEVTAEIVADDTLSPGDRIRRSVEATFEAVGCNTNLGILLLTVPLAVAAGAPALTSATLSARTGEVLDQLDAGDAAAVFAAIARASPGGLGDASQYDVRTAPPAGISLNDAMRAAASRDLIASAYRDRFAPVFALAKQLSQRAKSRRLTEAVTLVFLDELAATPDTHIARKHGRDVAVSVRDQGHDFLQRSGPLFGPTPFSPEALAAPLDFDKDLKARDLNPGTLADLIVAAAFARGLMTGADENA